MLNIKEWIEKEIPDVKVTDTVFRKPPKPPYIVYDDEITYRGSDCKNCILEHSIILELYTATRISQVDVSARIDALLFFVEYNTGIDYIKDTELYCKTYTFNIIEKE